jgi:hypothetical protein
MTRAEHEAGVEEFNASRPPDLVTTTEGQGRPALRGWSGSVLGAPLPTIDLLDPVR